MRVTLTLSLRDGVDPQRAADALADAASKHARVDGSDWCSLEFPFRVVGLADAADGSRVRVDGTVQAADLAEAEQRAEEQGVEVALVEPSLSAVGAGGGDEPLVPPEPAVEEVG